MFRARFKEHRGIFSNPRLLKLAKANSRSTSNRPMKHYNRRQSLLIQHQRRSSQFQNQIDLSSIDMNIRSNSIPNQ